MQIKGTTKVCGLLGKPVEHTLSPILHNGLAEELGHDLLYAAFEIEEEKLQEGIKGINALGFLGMNITVPYKTEVIPFLKEIDPIAEQIGAVNTLVSIEGGYKGYNTDIEGLLRDFNYHNIIIKDKKVIILGAGGASRAAAFLCAREGATSIYLLNRTLAKAIKIANDIVEIYPQCKITVLDLEAYQQIPLGNYIAIQGTSIGLSPNINEVIIEDPLFYQKISVGYDIIYNPAKTKFMSLVEEQGGLAYHGLGMLLYQGIKAYELWNNITIDEDVAQKISTKLKKELMKNA